MPGAAAGGAPPGRARRSPAADSVRLGRESTGTPVAGTAGLGRRIGRRDRTTAHSPAAGRDGVTGGGGRIRSRCPGRPGLRARSAYSGAARICGLRPATAGRRRKRPRLHHRRVVERPSSSLMPGADREGAGQACDAGGGGGHRADARSLILMCHKQRRKRPCCAQIHPPPLIAFPPHESRMNKAHSRQPANHRRPSGTVGRGFFGKAINSGICTKDTGFFHRVRPNLNGMIDTTPQYVYSWNRGRRCHASRWCICRGAPPQG